MPVPTITHFGHWLRDEIADRGLTQFQFAIQSRIPYATLRAWISMASPPLRRVSRVRLARGLKVRREVIDQQLDQHSS